MVHIKQPLPLHTVESNHEFNKKDAQRIINTDYNNYTVENSHLVPRTTETVGQANITTTSENCSTRPGKRKIFAIEEQEFLPIAWRISGASPKSKVWPIQTLILLFPTNV
ncbi:hypothetical protein AYI68_g5672 [Smittium mucronatum]|uniref:Uncharacterized protein n=1 Tax=Smittium mucronatum TaxID=133383 RepID=A0A1R0GTL1_9FUNG|nr:hypothetical protein AYI68_g5672 [Smittium mucronatum]